jgi:phage tail sheath protein FI
LETWPYLSLATDAKTPEGSSNFVLDVLNNKSQYVWAANIDAQRPTNVTASAFANSTVTGSVAQSVRTQRFNGGAQSGALSLSNYQTGFDTFEDADTIQVDFLIAPSMGTAAAQTTMVNDLVTTAEKLRKDCIVVASPARDDVISVQNAATITSSITDFSSTLTSSSYLVVDNNFLKVYDKYNDNYVYIPSASSTAGIMASTDAVAAPWFSPAGNRRGQYFGVSSLAWNATKSQRDALYKAGVNPVVNLPGQGILLFGDKTKLARPSAFDRINVRRLFLVMERSIKAAAQNVMFEFNDEFTRAEFVNIVEPFLREIKGRRGITDFRVVCDETNNTAQVIDTNQFVADIYVKPARSINYVTLSFVAVRTGVDFDEVVGLA